MQYFGVPICPYCKKRVNLIRTWSLKKQGEYKCPRCGGISNIYLSPLIYVFAVIALFVGGAIYFFHKFILNDIALSTALQVFIPFAIFFFLSIFMVYLAKPVIKRVSRAEIENGKLKRKNPEERRTAVASSQTGRVFTDYGDYNPKMDYVTGPVQQTIDEDIRIHEENPRQQYRQNNFERTSTIDVPNPSLEPPTRRASPKMENPVQRQVYSNAPSFEVFEPTVKGTTSRAERNTEAPAPRPRVRTQPPTRRAEPSPMDMTLEFTAPQTDTQQQSAGRVVNSMGISSSNDDFFAKYDDPAYIDSRLNELKENRKRGQ